MFCSWLFYHFRESPQIITNLWINYSPKVRLYVGWLVRKLRIWCVCFWAVSQQVIQTMLLIVLLFTLYGTPTYNIISTLKYLRTCLILHFRNLRSRRGHFHKSQTGNGLGSLKWQGYQLTWLPLKTNISTLSSLLTC